MIKLGMLARNDSGDAIVDLIDAGSANPSGIIEIRSGTVPASPESAAVGTLLSTLVLSYPAFGNFNNGLAVANAVESDSDAAATGYAGWFRVKDRDRNTVFDGTITVNGGGGDIEFDDVYFIRGGTVSLISLQAVMPMMCSDLVQQSLPEFGVSGSGRAS